MKLVRVFCDKGSENVQVQLLCSLNGEPHWKRALATSTDIILKILQLIKYLKVGYRKGRMNLHLSTFSQTGGEPITVQTCGVIECV